MNGTSDIPRVSDVGNRALLAAQFALFAYICALVGDTQDAQDVLQETNLKICRELGSYDPSRPFLPWAKRVAYYEVLSYRTRKSRDRLTLADDAFFEQVAVDAEHAFDDTDKDMAHLDACMRKLASFARELVEARYIKGVAVKDLAKACKCSPNAVSLILFKARRALALCIEKARIGDVPS